MDFQEIKLLDDFTQILKQYDASPFGFRLRKTGRCLKLIEYNGLYYLNLQNLYNLTDELLGPNIPIDIISYLESITFSEEITIETKNGLESCQVTCVQFLDERFFDKCLRWLENKSNTGFESIKDNILNRFYRDKTPLENGFDTEQSKLDSMFPFQDLCQSENEYNTNKMKIDRYYTDPRVLGKAYGTYSRPRGKNMEKIPINSKERPFLCDVPFCNRAFKRHEHLKRHQKMHSGERPFKCTHPGCMKAFSRSDNLAQHYRTHNMKFKKNEDFANLVAKKYDNY